MIGALVVCFFNLRKNSRLLAIALGFAAGVMLYISAVDIYSAKSVYMFKSAGFSDALAFTYATICFFCGFPIIWTLDHVCHWLANRGAPGVHLDLDGPDMGLPHSHPCPHRAHTGRHRRNSDAALQSVDEDASCCKAAASFPASTSPCCDAPPTAAGTQPQCVCDAETAATLSASDSWCATAQDMETGLRPPPPASAAEGTAAAEKGAFAAAQPLAEPKTPHLGECLAADCSSDEEVTAERARSLVRSGILCALAVGLHNLPEGLVTFVGYMDSMGSGITTAVAIAIHNIPEGLVIASAMSAGTGSKMKGVLWALLASVSEPVGGLIGLAVVCGGQMTDTVFGILFGLVGGIMVYVSIKELLPTAHRFDPQDKVTSASVLCGALVMACSLIAIAFSMPPVSDEAAAPGAEAATAATPQRLY
ncbi:hypothetical protein HYH03_009961 [Edaphochlamys debaryana]|uniref:Zinc transporter n=1 Tax=Edaphochlamys debaryana TaxID=47281 RepID=A0A836BWK4_9CHLO|nr:hypothetical protein HYH03_009961 [Edaphochlamys debaryana]|eukprot:KAG2491801.1 hypothetical protein HYH03_009961 [Edaphochlamys debaryana]